LAAPWNTLTSSPGKNRKRNEPTPLQGSSSLQTLAAYRKLLDASVSFGYEGNNLDESMASGDV
jgi:hypothetical protein